jgi:uncharacterized protein YcaQ
MPKAAPETVPTAAARRLLLAGAGLADPPRKATRATTLAAVRALGFVQVDSINAVERAHHLILHARLDAYRTDLLRHHLETSRELFEHWTHDASVIRRDWLPWWGHRFERDRVRLSRHAWMRERLGTGWKRTLAEVRDAIAERGPLSTRDFPAKGRTGEGWWDWSPHKAALELLWRGGEIAVHSRRGFEKVYDLSERVHGKATTTPTRHDLIGFACREALDRLGAATPRELAQFMNLVTLAEAKAWAARATRDGRAVAVTLDRIGKKPAAGIARTDWRRAAAAEIDSTPRALAPFDPLVRDRTRLAGLFGFDYRFEAFVPAAKRVHGYYTLPILAGERFVARVDASSDRERDTLSVRRAWLEDGPAAAARKSTIAACERLAASLGFSLSLDRKAFA